MPAASCLVVLRAKFCKMSLYLITDASSALFSAIIGFTTEERGGENKFQVLRTGCRGGLRMRSLLSRLLYSSHLSEVPLGRLPKLS